MAEANLAGERLFLGPTLQRVRGAVVEPEYVTATEDGLVSYVSVRGEAFESFEDALAVDDTVADPLCTDVFSSRRVYRLGVQSDAVRFTPRLAELGARVVDIRSDDGGWLVRARIPGRDALVSFREFCLERDVTFGLRQLYDPGQAAESFGSPLPRDQRELLLTAHESGYFEVPRRISQTELAESLDISPSAVSQQLRRATDELVARTLSTGREDDEE